MIQINVSHCLGETSRLFLCKCKRVWKSKLTECKQIILEGENYEKEFFEDIEKSRYSVGLSYSDVDMPYVKEICDRLRKSKKMRASRWYLEEYDSVERRNEFKRKITKVRYSGNFAEFKM